MITATIQSMVRQGTSLIVQVAFSDQGLIPYTFGSSDTLASISARIQSDVDAMNGMDYQLSTLQPTVVGVAIQTSPQTLATLTTNIDATNTAAINSIKSQSE